MCGGKAAAVCTLYSGPSEDAEQGAQQGYDTYSALLTPHGRECFQACHGAGGLW